MQMQLKERPVMDLNSGIIETYEVVKKSLDEQLHQTYIPQEPTHHSCYFKQHTIQIRRSSCCDRR